VPDADYKAPEPVKGVLLSCFAPTGRSSPTHTLIVNLDYTAEKVVGLRGPGDLSIFSPVTGLWSPTNQARIELRLPPGGGRLLRTTDH
jgi:hypothetical protein